MERLLRVGSITYAQKAQNLLQKSKIAVSISRARDRNCSYGVLVKVEEAERALSLLTAAGIRVS